MNVYVCIKQVPDTEASLTVKDGKGVNEAAIKWIVSPYDEYAIEEALKLKEKAPGTTVTAVTVGPERAQNALRTALAMGADRAVHIAVDAPLDPPATARALAWLIGQDPDRGVVFMGRQAIDDDAGQVHALTAELLGLPLATAVTAFSLADRQVRVERETEGGGKEVLHMAVPCVVAASKGLNTPRYASMMGIMKAKKMEIRKLPLAETGVAESDVRIVLQKLTAPPEKPQGRIIQGEPQAAVAELVRLLREEAKVL